MNFAPSSSLPYKTVFSSPTSEDDLRHKQSRRVLSSDLQPIFSREPLEGGQDGLSRILSGFTADSWAMNYLASRSLPERRLMDFPAAAVIVTASVA